MTCGKTEKPKLMRIIIQCTKEHNWTLDTACALQCTDCILLVLVVQLVLVVLFVLVGLVATNVPVVLVVLVALIRLTVSHVAKPTVKD